MKPFHNLLEKLLQGPCNWSPLNAKLYREWWETPQAWLSINVYYLKLFSENETTLSECSFIPPKLESCHSHWGSIPWHPPQHHKPVSAKSWHRVLTNQTELISRHRQQFHSLCFTNSQSCCLYIKINGTMCNVLSYMWPINTTMQSPFSCVMNKVLCQGNCVKFWAYQCWCQS